MYFAYGWPRVAQSELAPDDAYVYIHPTDKYVFVVTRKSVQLWTGGMHRVRLSESLRNQDDLKQEGHNVAAIWSSAKATLAILTSENYLHLYAIHTWRDTLLPNCNFAAKDIQKVDIYLRSSIKMESESRALSITGDSRLLMVGFADGTVATLSWLGKVREAAFPLDDVSEYASSINVGGMAEADSYRSLPQLDQPASTSPALHHQHTSQTAQLLPGQQQVPGVHDGSHAPPRDDESSYNGSFARLSGDGPGGTATPLTEGLAGATASRLGGGGFGPPSTAIVQLSYCERSKQIVMVLGDGACVVCATSDSGLSPLSELCFGRWLCGSDRRVICAQVGARAQLIAVGRQNGEVDLFRLHRTAVGSPGMHDPATIPGPGGLPLEAPVRTLSLESWGHKAQQTGAAVQVEWSPDCRAVAVGYAQQGVVVWSPSGCRLMCSLRQPGLSTMPSFMSGGLSQQPSAAQPGRALSGAPSMGRISTALSAGAGGSGVPLDGGVAALAWGPLGYQLLVAESGGSNGLAELQFAHSLPNHHRVSHAGGHSGSAGEEVHVLQAHDRLLLIREASEATLFGAPWAAGDGLESAGNQVGDLLVAHVALPHSYISTNWPLARVAVTSNGGDIAVAGRHGLALYSRTSERWRLFGDVSQERSVSCRALGWLGNGIVVVCSGPDPDGRTERGLGGGTGAGAQSSGSLQALPTSHTELLLFPRYHLDFTSLLARYPLPQPPLAMDCLQHHILLASEPLEMTLLEVVIEGQLDPASRERARAFLAPVRQISLFDVGRPLSDVALVPLMVSSQHMAASELADGGSPLGSEPGTAALAPAPRQVVLLRWGGLLSVLDLERGSEVATGTEVEAFWLSDPLTCSTGADQAPGILPYQTLLQEAQGGGGADGMAGSGGGAPPPQGGGQGHHGHGHGSPSTAAGHRAAAAAAASASAALTLDVEMPWWLYGPVGMQLLFPSSLQLSPLSPLTNDNAGGGPDSQDIELEFDQEVYPVGISLADDAIIGITQRIVRGPGYGIGLGGSVAYGPTASQLPCFHPIPESQPVLPCLLRRLLQRGAFPEAVSLAGRHARGPHFARSLEWLLFTALEHETSRGSAAGGGKGAAALKRSTLSRSATASEGGMTRSQSLLVLAAELVRQFPQLFAEVVVSVARKTDAALWPPLFDAVGSPSSLLEGLLASGELASAACFLLVIDRLEGATAAQSQALRLMRAALARGLFPLCGELLRFVVPPPETEGGIHARISGDWVSNGNRNGDSKHAAAGSAAPAAAGGSPTTSGTSAFAQPQVQSQGGAPEQARTSEGGSEAGQPSTSGRSWLGWLLGYGTGEAAGAAAQNGASAAQPAATATDGMALEPHPQPGTAPGKGLQQADAHPADAPAGAALRVQHALALLGEAGNAASPRTPGSHGATATPSSPAPPVLGGYLLGGVATGPGSAATASDACRMFAGHAWSLLEGGHLAALAQLASATCFMPGGLEGLMNLHRDDTPYARACAAAGPQQLLACLSGAVSEFPVWSGEEVEARAGTVAALCRAVGALPWALALAVLLVDVETVSTFRQQRTSDWAQFVDLLYADSSFSYLYEILDVLSKGTPALQGRGGLSAMGGAGYGGGAGSGVEQHQVAMAGVQDSASMVLAEEEEEGEEELWQRRQRLQQQQVRQNQVQLPHLAVPGPQGGGSGSGGGMVVRVGPPGIGEISVGSPVA